MSKCKLLKICCLLFVLFVFNKSLNAQFINPGSWPLITTPRISLKNIDHNSLGILVTLPDGNLLNIFRLDTGFTGNHVGNSGKMVQRYSYNNGFSWTLPQTIYDSNYDDRILSGGISDSGRVVCFFNRFDASTDTIIDLNLIYSDNNGVTWSIPQVLSSEAVSNGTSKMFGNHLLGYYSVNYSLNYIELIHSNDGILWDSIVYSWDYRLSQQYKMTEASFEYLGNGIILGLWRNESGVLGENFLQVESYDYGQTWTEPCLTNIADGYFCPSPWLFYDSLYNDLWVIATDRRANLDYTLNHTLEEIWFYKMLPSEVLGNPTGYNLFAKTLRPFSNAYRFFGYPYSTRKPNGDYIVIFTENNFRNNGSKGESAYLYQMDILYNDINSLHEKNIFQNQLEIYPNPFINSFTVTGKVNFENNEKVSLTIMNSKGETIFCSETGTLTDYSFLFKVNDLNLTAGIYLCVVKGNTYYNSQKIVKF